MMVDAQEIMDSLMPVNCQSRELLETTFYQYFKNNIRFITAIKLFFTDNFLETLNEHLSFKIFFLYANKGSKNQIDQKKSSIHRQRIEARSSCKWPQTFQLCIILRHYGQCVIDPNN